MERIYATIASQLLHEAKCRLAVADATRSVREAEQRLAECKSHENLLLQQLHDARIALTNTCLTEADMYIGHVRNSVDFRLGIEDEIRRYLESVHMFPSNIHGMS